MSSLKHAYIWKLPSDSEVQIPFLLKPGGSCFFCNSIKCSTEQLAAIKSISYTLVYTHSQSCEEQTLQNKMK